MFASNIALVLAAFGFASSVAAQTWDINNASAIIVERSSGPDDYSVDQIRQLVDDNINYSNGSLVMFDCGTNEKKGIQYAAVAALYNTEIPDGLEFQGPEIVDPATGAVRTSLVQVFSPGYQIINVMKWLSETECVVIG